MPASKGAKWPKEAKTERSVLFFHDAALDVKGGKRGVLAGVEIRDCPPPRPKAHVAAMLLRAPVLCGRVLCAVCWGRRACPGG